jgi:hypothetical protein
MPFWQPSAPWSHVLTHDDSLRHGEFALRGVTVIAVIAGLANVLLSSFAHRPYAHSMRVPIPCSAGSLTSVLANDGQQNRMLVAPEVAGGLKRAAKARPGQGATI